MRRWRMKMSNVTAGRPSVKVGTVEIPLLVTVMAPARLVAAGAALCARAGVAKDAVVTASRISARRLTE